MGCLGRAAFTLNLISAPDQPGRKQTCHYTRQAKSLLITLISKIAVEVGINMEGVQKLPNQLMWSWNKCGTWDLLEKKLVHKCNKRGVEGGINLRN